MTRLARLHELSARVDAVLFKSRNPMGEFEANDGTEVDSHAMTKAYGLPGKVPGGVKGVAAAAGGTVAAALLARKFGRRKPALAIR